MSRTSQNAARSTAAQTDGTTTAWALDAVSTRDGHVARFDGRRLGNRCGGADGKEIFFLSGRTIMAADVRADGPAFHVGVARDLFEAGPDQRNNQRNRYVVSPRGQRFLIVVDDQQTSSSMITVVDN